jgi:uncharacterized delta-60 repeat protein
MGEVDMARRSRGAVLRAVVIAALVTVVPLATPLASAAAGDLDVRFGVQGRAVAPLSDGAQIYGSVITRGGDVVTASYESVGGVPRSVLHRFTRRGAPDLDFGTDGRLLLAANSFVRTIVADGAATLVVLWIDDPDPVTDVDTSTVIRLLPDGRVDPSFTGGVRRTFVDSVDGRVTAVAVDGLKRVVLAFQTDVGPVTVRRLQPNGLPDVTFSGDGRSEIPVPDAVISHIVSLRSEGILCVGSARLRSQSAGGSDPVEEIGLVLAQLTPSGGVDRRFSDDGVTTDGRGLGTSIYPTHVAVDSAGRIVAALAQRTTTGRFTSSVVRFTRSGLADTSFSRDGRIPTSGAIVSGPGGLVVQADDKVVVVVNADGGIRISRYVTTGRPDRTFSGDGRRTLSFAPGRTAGALTASMTQNGRSLRIAGFVGPQLDVVGMAALQLR